VSSILVVDDELTNFEIIEGFLIREDYQLDYASSGFKALTYLETQQPDLVLLDVMMPGMDGIETIQRLKSNTAWRHIPVLMVTALNSKEDLARCLAAGADDYVSKPVNSIELRARIRSMLRIKQQYDDLKNLMQLRQDLTSMVVHDLRNPVASILLACEVLKLTELHSKQQKKVEQVQNAGQRLQTIIDSLLIMAKLESGKMVLNWSEVDLCQMGQQVLRDFEPIAALKSIQLISVMPPAAMPKIWLDEAVFQRVLENLLSNALKFSPSGSRVTLRVDYPNPAQVSIRVLDEGKGVSEALRERIFEKFETGNFVEGVAQTGLGLAFCKMAVTAHRGSIVVEDNHPHGAVFRIDLETALPPI
jgi:two-component system, sensor histidine kinase and response regulator